MTAEFLKDQGNLEWFWSEKQPTLLKSKNTSSKQVSPKCAQLASKPDGNSACKVQIFLEVHKNWKNLPISLKLLSNIKKSGIFFYYLMAFSQYLNFNKVHLAPINNRCNRSWDSSKYLSSSRSYTKSYSLQVPRKV